MIALQPVGFDKRGRGRVATIPTVKTKLCHIDNGMSSYP